MATKRNLVEAWKSYITGNVATDSCVRYITNFCGATLTSAAKDESDEEEKDPTDDEWDAPPLELKGPLLERILHRAMHRAEAAGTAEPQTGLTPQAPPEARRRRNGVDAKNDRAVKRGRLLWTSPKDAGVARSRTKRPTIVGDVGTHVKARRKKREEPPLKPFTGKTQPRADYYAHATRQSMHEWLREVSCRAGEKPNEEQLEFLRAVVRRI